MKSRIASALCVLPSIYFGGCLLFALWNFDDYGTAWPQFLRYVAAPGLLCLLFGSVALFGSRVSRVTLGGTAIAVLLAMFAFETRMERRFAAALEDIADVPSGAAMAGAGLARSLPPARTPQKLNADAHVVRLQDALLSGIPGERVLLCKRDGVPIVYRADRYGFRNPDTIYDQPVERLLLGDSFVEGLCLPEGKDLTGQSRALRPATVGMGVRGAGPLIELAALGRFGPVIRPHWVVIVFYEGNDWENLEHEVRYAWLKGVLAPGSSFGPAIMPATQRERAEQVIASWNAVGPVEVPLELRKSNLLRNSLALHQTWTQLGLGYPKVAPTIPVYDAILRRTSEIAATWGGRVALLYVPQTGRLLGLLPDGFVYDQIRWQVGRAAVHNHIQFVDLSPAFAANPDRLGLYARDGHFSERGAALAARLLHRALRAHEEKPE